MAGQRHTREQSGLWQCQTERRAGRWPGAPSGLYPARGQSALSIDKAEPPVSCRPYVCITRAKKHSKMKFGASDWIRHLEGGKCSGRRPDHLPPLMTFVRLRVRRLQPHSPRDCNTDFSCSSAPLTSPNNRPSPNPRANPRAIPLAHPHHSSIFH